MYWVSLHVDELLLSVFHDANPRCVVPVAVVGGGTN